MSSLIKTCPKCGNTLDIPKIGSNETNYFGFFPANSGITCNSCNTNIAIRQWKAQLFRPIATGLLVGGLMVALRYIPAELTWVIVVIVIVIILIIENLASRLLALELPKSGETLQVIYIDNEIPSNIDVLLAEHPFSEIRKFEEQLKQEDCPPWICSNCREENPGTFEICWKCENAKQPLSDT